MKDANIDQIVGAIAALKYLDIITDADVKYMMMPDGSRGTQKFYDGVMTAVSKIPTSDANAIAIEEVNQNTASVILFVAEQMIGEEEAEKFLSVRPLYADIVDLIVSKETK